MDISTSQRLAVQKLYNSLLDVGYGDDSSNIREEYINFPHITYINPKLLAMVLLMLKEQRFEEAKTVSAKLLKHYYNNSMFETSIDDVDIDRLRANVIKYVTAVSQY